MTSTPIAAEANSAYSNSVQGAMPGKTKLNQVDFGLLINQAAVGSQEDFQTQTNTSSKKQKPLEINEVNKESYGSVQDKISAKETDVPILENLEEKVKELEENIKESVLDIMDVSEEELEVAMQILGLQFVDLNKPENVANIVTQLMGTTEPVELLMNENFQQLFQTIEELTAELSKSLGIDVEQVHDILANLEQNVLTESPMVKETIVLQDVNLQTNPVKQEEEMIQREIKESVPSGTTILQKGAGELKSNLADASDTTDTEFSNSEASDNNENEHFDTMQSLLTKEVNTTNALETVDQTIKNDQPDVDTENIMKQISEAIKVNVSQESTTMELQLNPENLGKINIQVVEKSGIIVAKIVTENEAVKTALESQIVQLRENMDNQGLRVAAIEVTTASHEFEKNLEENQQKAQQEDSKQNAGDRRRNLNLSDLEDIQGIMSEEENIAVKMMLQNGNTIDYSA